LDREHQRAGARTVYQPSGGRAARRVDRGAEPARGGLRVHRAPAARALRLTPAWARAFCLVSGSRAPAWQLTRTDSPCSSWTRKYYREVGLDVRQLEWK